MAKKKTTKIVIAESCYVIELGLDGAASPRYDGTYSYLMSLVKVDAFDTNANPAAAWFTDLKKGDRFVFRVFNYDVTEGMGLPDIEVKGLFARFLAPDDPAVAAACTDEDMICTGRDYYPVPGPGTPSSARKGAKGWRFLGADGKERSFQFTAGKKKARLHVSVAATFPSKTAKELRWFTHDPEIFVGEGSGN